MAGGADRGYQDTFEQRGRRYDDAMRRWPSVRDEEFAFVLDLARPVAGERLVDIPSGGGYLGDHVGDDVRVVSVEIAEAFVERGRARGIEAVRGALTGDELPAAEADVVVSVAGMHHEDDHGELLRCWRRLLRPGGRLVAADVVAGSAEALFLDGFVGEWTSTGHAGTYFGDDLVDLAVEAGYTEALTVEGRYHWWADDEAALVSFCTELFALEEVEPSTVRDALESGPGIVRGPDGRVGLQWGLRAVVGRAQA